MKNLLVGLALLAMTGVAYAANCCDGLACCGNCPLC